MSGVYTSDGGWNITLVGQDDLPVSLYALNGSIRVTTDTGRGVYAPNGSIRVQSITVPGIYNPNGNIQGVLSGSVFYPAWMNAPASGGGPFLIMTTGSFILLVDGSSKLILAGS